MRYLLVVQNLMDTILLCWPYILVMICFGIFVLVNGGIVMGDKSNHVASIHAEQMFYFLGFTLFFASPLLITVKKLKTFITGVKTNPYIYIIIAIFCAGLILQHNHVHPFLLADNRHYTFYLWRWLLGSKLIRLCLIPCHIFTVWSMNDLLNRENKSELWKLVFCTCVIFSLVPQLLLEPRYFILPYIVFRLNVSVSNHFTLFCEFLLYIAVNAFTIIVFMQKTFYWEDIPEPQRIIW